MGKKTDKHVTKPARPLAHALLAKSHADAVALRSTLLRSCTNVEMAEICLDTTKGKLQYFVAAKFSD